MEKRGQFYLIAAFIIISIMMGVATVSNSLSTQKGSERIYDIKNELEVEREYVLSYGVAKGVDIIELIETFTSDFTNASKELEFYIISGDEENLESYKYFNGTKETKDSEIVGDEIRMVVNGTRHIFNITVGENFHYVIFNSHGGEGYVSSNAVRSERECEPNCVESGGGESCTPDCSGVLDANTKLLIHSDTTDGSTTFTDSSDSEHIITRTGEVHHEVDQQKFGTTSIYFDGTGDYLSIPDHADWNFGGGDFTIDFWVRFNSLSQTLGFLGQKNGGSAEQGFYIYYDGASLFYFRWRATDTNRVGYSYSPSFSTNTWYHMAFVRNGTNFYIFQDGVPKSLTTEVAIASRTLNDCDGELTIGREANNFDLNGYLDEVRITKGKALWTSDFSSNLPSGPAPVDKECGSDGCTEDGCGICV